MPRITTLLGLFVLAAITGAPVVSHGAEQPPAVPDNGVLATVNGIPITQADVQLASKGAGTHGNQGAATNEQQVLENIIQQELALQRAVALSLHEDAVYQLQLARLEAQVNAFKRRKLSEAFFRQEVAKRAAVSDEDARHYFDSNAAQLRTDLHVWQILRRDAKSIEQVLLDLAGGTPFETVAGKGAPQLPSTVRKPWDLGYLKWSQIPDAWREVIADLGIGGTSQIIRGPRNRFWIIHLVDKREDPTIRFEDLKPGIMAILKNQKRKQLQEEIRKELRETARIVYPSRTAASRD